MFGEVAPNVPVCCKNKSLANSGNANMNNEQNVSACPGAEVMNNQATREPTRHTILLRQRTMVIFKSTLTTGR